MKLRLGDFGYLQMWFGSHQSITPHLVDIRLMLYWPYRVVRKFHLGEKGIYLNPGEILGRLPNGDLHYERFVLENRWLQGALADGLVEPLYRVPSRKNLTWGAFRGWVRRWPSIKKQSTPNTNWPSSTRSLEERNETQKDPVPDAYPYTPGTDSGDATRIYFGGAICAEPDPPVLHELLEKMRENPEEFSPDPRHGYPDYFNWTVLSNDYWMRKQPVAESEDETGMELEVGPFAAECPEPPPVPDITSPESA